jgi:hypothetical protein
MGFPFYDYVLNKNLLSVIGEDLSKERKDFFNI